MPSSALHNDVRIVGVVADTACFFFNDTATTEIYTLSLHDALPISVATREAIVALAAIERVIPGAPGDRVVEVVAGAIDVGAAGQAQVLDIVAEIVTAHA